MPMKLRLLPTVVPLVILALVLTSCFNERDENTNEGTRPSAGELVVEVELTDDGFEMPDDVPAGALLFEVTNSGTASHGFAIDGVEGGLDDLAPDQLDTVHLELEQGTYTVYSPVEGDREAGLERELTVTEAVDEGGAPLNDEGVGPSEEQDPIDD
jgi:hypothetical protein